MRMSSKESSDIVRIELIEKKITYKVEPAVLPPNILKVITKLSIS